MWSNASTDVASFCNANNMRMGDNSGWSCQTASRRRYRRHAQMLLLVIERFPKFEFTQISRLSDCD